MRIAITQMYIRPGISFPFSHLFQRWMSEELAALIRPSADFIYRYGDDFSLVFNLSAKTGIQTMEIQGPAVFKRTKDVEYTIFLPYDRIAGHGDIIASAVRCLLDGIVSVFKSLGIDATEVEKRIESMIQHVCSDSSMMKEGRR